MHSCFYYQRTDAEKAPSRRLFPVLLYFYRQMDWRDVTGWVKKWFNQFNAYVTIPGVLSQMKDGNFIFWQTLNTRNNSFLVIFLIYIFKFDQKRRVDMVQIFWQCIFEFSSSLTTNYNLFDELFSLLYELYWFLRAVGEIRVLGPFNQTINQVYFCIAHNHKLQFVAEGFTDCTGVTSSVLRPSHQVRKNLKTLNRWQESWKKDCSKYHTEKILNIKAPVGNLVVNIFLCVFCLEKMS